MEINNKVNPALPWLKYLLLAIGPALFFLFWQAGEWILPANLVLVTAVSVWLVWWWVTEAVPLAVTSLLPLVLFPCLGILDLPATATNYCHPTVFLFMAGFIFALAMEKHQLHVRIALHIIRFIGFSSQRLVLGFMVATAFISLWINNTAAALLMLPIATSVLSLLETEMQQKGLENDYRKISRSLLISITYSAVIGGMGTIIGSPTNLVMVAYLKEVTAAELTFLQWFLVGFPVAVLMLAAAYVVLVKVLFRVKAHSFPDAAVLLEEKLRKLGPMSYQEYAVSALFGCTAIGWTFRDLIAIFFTFPFLNDTIIGMGGALLLFLIPDAKNPSGFLLDWKSMDKLAWGILLLLGGGLALAKALETSGMIRTIGSVIAGSGNQSYPLLLLEIVLTLTFLTQFIGNTALNTIALPMVLGIAASAGINPLLLAFPATFAVSFSYTLPMSTAPNAVVFVGDVRIKDMASAGSVLALAGIAVVLIIFIGYCLLVGPH